MTVSEKIIRCSVCTGIGHTRRTCPSNKDAKKINNPEDWADSKGMRTITVHVPEKMIEYMDTLIQDKVFPNRSEMIRHGIRTVIEEHTALYNQSELLKEIKRANTQNSKMKEYFHLLSNEFINVKQEMKLLTKQHNRPIHKELPAPKITVKFQILQILQEKDQVLLTELINSTNLSRYRVEKILDQLQSEQPIKLLSKVDGPGRPKRVIKLIKGGDDQ